MKTTPLLLALSLLLGTTAITNAQSQEIRQLEDTPVTVSDRTGGTYTNVTLEGIEGDEIRISIQGGGTMRVPIDQDNLRLYLGTPQIVRNASAQLRSGDYEEAYKAMRPIGFPLLKYMVIPERKFNIHDMVRIFYQAAVLSGAESEALYISKQLPLADIDPVFTSITLKLAEQIAASGRTQEAMQLLNQLPITAENANLLPLYLEFAGVLREQEKYSEALFLYQRLQGLDGTDVQRTATIWNAYCNLRLGNSLIATTLMEEAVGDIPKDSYDFSLYNMVMGSILLQENDSTEALAKLSQAIIYGDLSNDWMPETLYKAGLAYKQVGQESAGEAVHEELETFFPENSWTKKI